MILKKQLHICLMFFYIINILLRVANNLTKSQTIIQIYLISLILFPLKQTLINILLTIDCIFVIFYLVMSILRFREVMLLVSIFGIFNISYNRILYQSSTCIYVYESLLTLLNPLYGYLLQNVFLLTELSYSFNYKLA